MYKKIEKRKLLGNVFGVNCIKTVLIFRVQEDTVDNALKALEDRGIKQSMLLLVSGQYFIKADNTAIPLPCCSCFIEALEFLFMIFSCFLCITRAN